MKEDRAMEQNQMPRDNLKCIKETKEHFKIVTQEQMSINSTDTTC